MSADLLTDTQAYCDALNAYRVGEVAPIVSMMATAAIRAENIGDAGFFRNG